MYKLLPKTIHNRNCKGFTLVELLVVISIIAILAVVGFTVFSGVQKGARDAKRRADIEGISKALESHYNDTTSPCSATSALPYCASVDASFFSAGAVPTNPGPGGAAYSITIPAARTTYTACARLENNNGNSSTAGDGTTFTSATGAAATYFCEKNQQ